jgi:uncharacterized membrane protein YdcZ (DUF606 family)
MENLIAKVNALLGKLYIPCKVPADKQMHFICGLVIAALLTPFIGAYSILVVAVIAALKEIYDARHPDKHTADFWDWVATTLGGVFGFVVVALFG